MADPLRTGERPPTPRAAQAAFPHAREMVGELAIARALRTGALLSGTLFLASLLLSALPESPVVVEAVRRLREGGAVILLATPVVRLLVAGVSLWMKGEQRYMFYAVGVIGLLVMAVGFGFSA